MLKSLSIVFLIYNNMSAIQGKYVTAYTDGVVLNGFTNIGNIAIDTNPGAGDYTAAEFVGGIDETYDTTSYIIISDTTTALLDTRSTGGNTGVALPKQPTFFASKQKTEESFLRMVNRLPARVNQPKFTEGSKAKKWLNDNGYWTTFQPTMLVMDLNSATVSSLWTDLSGNNNNANFVGGRTIVQYNAEPVVSLNGNSQYIFPSGGFGTQLDNGFTYEVWAYPTATTNGTLIGEWAGDPSNWSGDWTDAQMAFVNGRINIGVYSGGYIQGPTFSVNTWYNIVSTYDGSKLSLYVNGSLINDQNIVKSNPGGTYLSLGVYDKVGYYIGNATGNFKGYLGSWRIWDGALSSSAILNNYNSTKSRFGL
jgi:hypothetical protein